MVWKQEYEGRRPTLHISVSTIREHCRHSVRCPIVIGGEVVACFSAPPSLFLYSKISFILKQRVKFGWHVSWIAWIYMSGVCRGARASSDLQRGFPWPVRRRTVAVLYSDKFQRSSSVTNLDCLILQNQMHKLYKLCIYITTRNTALLWQDLANKSLVIDTAIPARVRFSPCKKKIQYVLAHSNSLQ